jgi:hypothetical protein
MRAPIQAFQLAAEETTNGIYGEYDDLSIAPSTAGHTSVTKRLPLEP